MKKLLVLLLATLMLLTSCGGPGGTTETEPPVPKEDFSIAVTDDTYVVHKGVDGERKDENFGTEAGLILKGVGEKRYTLIKFDISSLVGDNTFKSIELDLTFYGRQFDNKNDAVIVIYGSDTNWSEKTVTYATKPIYYSVVANFTGLSIEEMKDGAVVTKSFPVTDYIKLCLAEGKTEASFYIEELTPGNGNRIDIYSKESGKSAPVLNVSYTKVDNTKYNGELKEVLPEVSENGLDSILGLSRNDKEFTISVKEDTYVQGNKESTPLGKETAMEIKESTNPAYNRISFVKFAIDDLYTNEFGSVFLRLWCHDAEGYVFSPVNVYGCDPYAWDEATYTYSMYKNKNIREELVATGMVKRDGVVSFDVTDYVNERIKLGEKEISFIIENDGQTAPAQRYMFDTKEREGGTPAYLAMTDELNFTTLLQYKGENPWQVAMDSVTTWFERWEEIKKGGDDTAQKIVWNKDEFTVTVSAATLAQTNGADTKYSDKATRLVSTLKSYKYNNKETELYDEYGGFKGGEKYEATGYFYTTKIGDRWWTIDPLGYPFYRVACVQVTPGVSSAQKKAIISEFKTNNKWAAWATDMLKDYGFNSTGGWSDIKTLSRIEEPLVQTKILGILGGYSNQVGLRTGHGGSTEMVGSIMPVFDPDFVTYADEKVKTETKGYEDKAYIYGWMSDNELPDDDYMLDGALQADPTDARFIYSYATAWTFMYLKTGKTNVSVYDVTTELRREFKAMVYDKYYEVVTAALDKHVPNHQYLGSRYIPENYKQEMIMRVSGYWCDVISINWYEAWTPYEDYIYNWQYWSGKPFIITEWYAKGMDIWEKDNRITNKSGAGFTVKTQEDRGMFYQNFALGLMECKACVGFDWFKYWDNDPDDLSADSSNRDSNKGMFSTTHEEYTALTKYMNELNNNKYSLIKFFDAR